MDIKTIIRSADGPAKLGRVLGLSHSTILAWKSVPPKHVPAISRLTGIPRHELRPDLWEAPATAPAHQDAAA